MMKDTWVGSRKPEDGSWQLAVGKNPKGKDDN